MSTVGRSLIVDADGPSPREEGVGDFTERPMALLWIGQPDPLVVPLLHRPHLPDMLGSAHLSREVLADEGLGLRNPDRLGPARRGRRDGVLALWTSATVSVITPSAIKRTHQYWMRSQIAASARKKPKGPHPSAPAPAADALLDRRRCLDMLQDPTRR